MESGCRVWHHVLPDALVSDPRPLRRQGLPPEPLLLRAGFKREPALEASSWNPVYVRGGGTASAAISPRCVACEHDHACRKEALKEAMPACDPLLEICH